MMFNIIVHLGSFVHALGIYSKVFLNRRKWKNNISALVSSHQSIRYMDSPEHTYHHLITDEMDADNISDVIDYLSRMLGVLSPHVVKTIPQYKGE